jgi:hypothetical protein
MSSRLRASGKRVYEKTAAQTTTSRLRPASALLFQNFREDFAQGILRQPGPSRWLGRLRNYLPLTTSRCWIICWINCTLLPTKSTFGIWNSCPEAPAVKGFHFREAWELLEQAGRRLEPAGPDDLRRLPVLFFISL